MASFWDSIHGISLIAIIFSVLWFIYILLEIKTDKKKRHKYIILSIVIFLSGIIFSIVGSVQKNSILSQQNKNSMDLTQKNKEFHTEKDGTFVLKGKVIWPAQLEITGTGKNKDMKPVTKSVDAGNFKVKLPAQKETLDKASYEIKAEYDNGFYRTWTFTVENLSMARVQYLIGQLDGEGSDSDEDDEDTTSNINITENQSKNPADYQTGITYSQIARTPDDYKYKKIQFSGEVAQVLEDDDKTQIRLAVNSDYDAMIFIDIDNDILGGKRILENDQVTVSGISLGTTTYESTMGGNITIPAMETVIVKNNSAN